MLFCFYEQITWRVFCLQKVFRAEKFMLVLQLLRWKIHLSHCVLPITWIFLLRNQRHYRVGSQVVTELIKAVSRELTGVTTLQQGHLSNKDLEVDKASQILILESSKGHNSLHGECFSIKDIEDCGLNFIMCLQMFPFLSRSNNE